jgi:hypothetical protein
MHRTLPATLAAVATVALTLPRAAWAAPPAGGHIEADGARIEILGRPYRAGDRIELPEGTLVVEESRPDDGQVGSFGVVPAESLGATSAAAPAPAGAGEPADAAPIAGECRAERAAYLSELWRASGIDVKDPPALVEGLQAGASGPGTGYLWFALATDAFRPLAWSSELRARADALARCVRGQGG